MKRKPNYSNNLTTKCRFEIEPIDTRFKKTISIKEVIKMHRETMKLLSEIPRQIKEEIKPNSK